MADAGQRKRNLAEIEEETGLPRAYDAGGMHKLEIVLESPNLLAKAAGARGVYVGKILDLHEEKPRVVCLRNIGYTWGAGHHLSLIDYVEGKSPFTIQTPDGQWGKGGVILAHFHNGNREVYIDFEELTIHLKNDKYL